MLYRLSADLILVVHAGFIAFVLVGLVLIWIGHFRRWNWTRSWWFRLAHLLAIALVVAQSLMRITCPLTDLENALRIRAGQDPYGDAGFIAHWLHKLIFFTAPHWVFMVCYSLFALLVIGTFIVAPPNLPWRRHRPAAASPPM